MPNQKTQPKKADIIAQVADRVRTSDNVLVALSKDPSVDELSAALGLTFALDKIGKHATAIFSGAIPNAIEFLEPEKTFEDNTDSLQDFIIALDKEKADHLRYKIDGDYVKVFITPYKTTINEDDMEFSHGDYNVDLVISLNVNSESDLDAALSEYGRIMHDATSINISTNIPGNFGELEWGDSKYSSVSEMIGLLLQILEGDDEEIFDDTVSTALLAGIVAATNRFSNEHTTPETMTLAAALMESGADQQLISSSIPVEILTKDVVDANEDLAAVEAEDEGKSHKDDNKKTDKEEPVDPSKISIKHGESNLKDKEGDINSSSTDDKKTTANDANSNHAPVAAPLPKDLHGKTKNAAHVNKPAPKPPVKANSAIPTPETTPIAPAQNFSRHGEVDFDPDEDLPPEEKAKKDAERAIEEEKRAREAERLRKKRAPIEAAIAEINAKNNLNAKNTKSTAIHGVKAEGEAAADPRPDQDEINSAARVQSVVVPDSREAEEELDAGLRSMNRPMAPTAIDELRSSSDTKHKIMPLGQVLERDDTPKDYASMMAAELNGGFNPMQAPSYQAPVPPAPAAPAMAAPMPQFENAPSAPTFVPNVAPSNANPMPIMPSPVAPMAAAPMQIPEPFNNNPSLENGQILPPPPAPFNAGATGSYMPPMPGMPPVMPASNTTMPPVVNTSLNPMAQSKMPQASNAIPSASNSAAYVAASMQARMQSEAIANEAPEVPAVKTAEVQQNDNRAHYLRAPAPQVEATPAPVMPTPSAPIDNSSFVINSPMAKTDPTPPMSADPGSFQIPGM